MSLVFNGTIVPEDTAKAFTYNGTDITDVYIDGVQVWKQSLFSATWSASSVYSVSSYCCWGIDISGDLARYRSYTSYAPWASVDSNGIFSTTTSTVSNYGYKFESNTIATVYNGTIQTTKVSFTPSGGFSGSSPAGGTNGELLETSGGLIRSGRSSGERGPWISLT